MDAESRDGRAVVFPGMGPNRFVDAARFMVVNSFARGLVATADEVLGYSLVDRWAQTEGDYSEAAQVAFLVNCLALARWAQHTNEFEAGYVVGPSFGGKAAAVHSGALDAADAIQMAARWARLLEDYFAGTHTDLVTCSFVRVPEAALAEVRAELDVEGQWHEVSCQVDTDFHMLTLGESRLAWLEQRLKAVGGMPLFTMRPPLHCSVFGELRERMAAEVFGPLVFRDPVVPVVSDHDGAVLRTGEAVRAMLLDGIIRTVRWPAAVAGLVGAGVGTAYVCGPDKLFGRVGVTTRAFDVTIVDPVLALRPRRRVLAAAGWAAAAPVPAGCSGSRPPEPVQPGRVGSGRLSDQARQGRPQ